MGDPLEMNERDALRKIGAAIAEARGDRSQRWLADHVGTTQTSIRRLESGETSVSAIVLLRAFKVLEYDLKERGLDFRLDFQDLISGIEPASTLVKQIREANQEEIEKGTSAMGLTKDDMDDFYTQRDLLRLMKLWPR